ncbi:hypothetical protein Forpe1208_v008145 [Fusarium oxysporum f. sp. rapae]|uniref:Nucleoside phosphorylase domain-containing protein n=1 Tax=Fusarium oxysporum f. sp. rapae TaxID=485398 RepID=A0A8J5P8C7_FUSOX|nr:hypothetical protein Forpe1208_v008145 [Fusarium oxysporum f. sp. rapae]
MDPLDYTVGWISAVTSEYVAAQVFLDEKHPTPRNISTRDPNHYTVGRIGHHNVVIAVLPYKQYGLETATIVATHMLHSFPNIEFGLMVGIGGGAPSRRHDIRLGDVVIGTASNDHGGVFNYDFGKAIQESAFLYTRSLKPPPAVLQDAVKGLREEHNNGHQLENSINAVLSQHPKLQENYQRPDSSHDRLYLSHAIHPSDTKASCNETCGSDPLRLVKRDQRTENENEPHIHYGLIASANTVCKDAELRDKLAEERDVLCFEMEAASLVNFFPCLVIRGICDYSDTHKNDEWQGYAAMAATAYAKDLLRHVPPSEAFTKLNVRACDKKWLTGHYSSLLMKTIFIFILFLLEEAISSNIGLKWEATGLVLSSS